MLTTQGYGYGLGPRSIIDAINEHQPLNDQGLTVAKLREAKRLLKEAGL